MRMALAFRRADVDEFLGELDADQYAEWSAFFSLEPTGWPALQAAVRRIVWAIFQRGRKDQVKELPFKTVADAMLTPAQQQIREEIDSIKLRARAAAGQKR